MDELTEFQWVYLFEVTAPIFYRVKRGHLKSEEDKKAFLHFEESEKPHAPQIKEFLRQQGRRVFPWPQLLEVGAATFSHLVSVFGEKTMYYFEYIFENKAVGVYTRLSNGTKDEKFREITHRLLEEELPHLEFFQNKLNKKSFNTKGLS